MTNPAPAELVEPMLDLAVGGATREAVQLAMDLLEAGVPQRDIILNLLAPVQREAGARWQRNDWSVVDEHVVTGVIQSAVQVLETLDVEIPSHPERGSVAVACAEQDWHALPAHMFANLLRTEGFAVSFLGSSTPADHVARFLTIHEMDALVICCNLPLFFNGVTRLAEAAHAEGVPVLAGGCALGTRADRALGLGADGWAADVSSAAAVLAEWSANGPPPLCAPTTDLVALDLEARCDELGALAFDALAERFPAMADYDERQRARTREDLVFIVRFVAAAQLVDDPTVLVEFLEWLCDLLVARHVPADAVTAGLEVLAPYLEDVSTATAGLVAHGLRFLHDGTRSVTSAAGRARR